MPTSFHLLYSVNWRKLEKPTRRILALVWKPSRSLDITKIEQHECEHSTAVRLLGHVLDAFRRPVLTPAHQFVASPKCHERKGMPLARSGIATTGRGSITPATRLREVVARLHLHPVIGGTPTDVFQREYYVRRRSIRLGRRQPKLVTMKERVRQAFGPSYSLRMRGERWIRLASLPFAPAQSNAPCPTQ